MSQENLKIYYDKIFPAEDFCRWLAPRDEKDLLFRRELSFTLVGDIYCRYQSFADAAEFRQNLIDRVPEKMDIGAVFSGCPKHYHQYGVASSALGGPFRPVERELVFDIDMDEYDGVRRCCKGANVCQKCWTFIAAAVRCLYDSLTEDFGFSKILFVFSGRRGVHCWISDEAAQRLSNEERSAVAEYLQIVQGGKAQLKRRGAANHPLVQRSAGVCQKYFEKQGTGVVDGQDLAAGEESVFAKIIQGFPSEMKDFVMQGKTSREVWQRLKEVLKKRKEGPSVEEVILEITYPRLDINVSKQMNHLLKAPFCIHPKTGKVCVPIMDIKNPETFNPNDVPMIDDIVNAVRDGTGTAVDPYLKFFRDFVDSVQKDAKRQDVDMSF